MSGGGKGVRDIGSTRKSGEVVRTHPNGGLGITGRFVRPVDLRKRHKKCVEERGSRSSNGENHIRRLLDGQENKEFLND